MAKIERTKNTFRNIFFGIILKIYQIIVPFLIRTVMIYLIGIEYLGLNSLFTSVLQVLNLAELGVGSAMIFSMYKPIAEDDTPTICALMNLYRIYYWVIGGIIAVVGLCLTPFIPNLISGKIPNGINIYILYLLNLGGTVLSYWLFAYKNSILQAYQRVDMISKVTLLTNTIQYGMQIFVLWVFRNYYYYVVVMLFSQALTNILTAYFADKLYPEIVPYGKLPVKKVRHINQRIRDLFTAKLGSVVVNSADTIVISAFLGLTVLAVYQNYYFIMNSICGFINVLFSSIMAGIGNSLVTESNEKNYVDFKKITFIICYILCICCCCFAGLYQPFMRIWVGEKLMLNNNYIILFCILFYCLELSMVWATVKDAAGLWHSDRFRPLIGASVNLIINIILVQIIGLYGIILSTIISYIFISMPWLVHNLFHLLYKGSVIKYVIEIFLYIVVTMLSVSITLIICQLISLSGVIGLLIKGLICLIVPIAIQSIVFQNKKEYLVMKALIVNMIKKRY